MLALAVESGFALHTSRNFGPFISARGGGSYLRVTGGELGAARRRSLALPSAARRPHHILGRGYPNSLSG